MAKLRWVQISVFIHVGKQRKTCVTSFYSLAFPLVRPSLADRTKKGPEASGKNLFCTSTCDSEESPG